jgi:hypothetical protein
MAGDIGDFEHRVLTAAYTPNVRIHHPYNTPFGMSEQVVYFYGGWREADGTLHVFERKFIGPMTAGLWLMNARGGSVSIEPVSASTVRGEVKRQYTDNSVLLHGAMMEKVGGSGGEFRFEATNDSFTWTEGDVLALNGGLVGPGVQIYSPDRSEPILYISELYKVGGRVLNDDVEGFVFYDHAYWPSGYDWKEFRVFKDLQLGWEAFANEYDDGTVEWGHLCLGRQGFNFAAVAGRECAIVMDSAVTGGVDVGEDDWAQRATWRASSGEEWSFQLEDGGRLSEFSAARWGGYRAQAGHTRRIGDDRNVRLGFSWLETFADRLRESGIPAVDKVATGRPPAVVGG